MMLSHRNLLELEDWIAHETPTPYGDLESFQKEFGEYVIVGWSYGGEILFESVYSSRTDNDKTSVSAALWYVDVLYVNAAE